jgi:Flp pilus assembly protein TadD
VRPNADGIDGDYADAVTAIKAGHFAAAIPLMQSYVARNPRDAYAETWLGFAYRKVGHMDDSFAHYDRALALDPELKRAHEYLGEAYLISGNLDKAREHLQILDHLCFLPCEEYSLLKQAVADYQGGHFVDGPAK